MNTLTIHHVENTEPAVFEVHRMADGKHSKAASVSSPVGYPVKGMDDGDLTRELRWYLEDFLQYPFPPATDRAERAQAALKAWGEEAFKALFDGRPAATWYETAVADGLDHLQIQVSSDDPRVLAWPWEALNDPERGYLAFGCHLERRLNQVADAAPLPDALPTDRVNILLVVARPFEADVQYRSISRPLVELVESRGLPAEVTVLRPPTFGRLRDHLLERPGYYHILHFDGHGAYGVLNADADSPPPHMMQAPQGHLVFETDDGTPDPIDARRLSDLLREHRLPAVVLNACQSATVDQQAEDAFASVAASLIRAGVHSTVAMAYSVYVSAAQEFLPAFYGRLFQTGDLAQATRAGRQQMRQQQDRVCPRGTYPLEDWLVPVVYQQAPMDFSFAAKAAKGEGTSVELPAEARDEENPHGFIGRDGAVLELERAMRRPPAGILICGLGGVGKTTLARGFVHWLAQTGGLGHGCFWFTFNAIRSAEFVLNRMGEALFGPQFITAEPDAKVEALAAAFREHPFVIVWDNFESASGIDTAGIAAMLTSEDRGLLRTFLERLRGGQTKVLITSRSEEDWLGPTNCFKLGLGGLVGEERWEFCRVILRDLGRTIDRADPDLVDLMEVLDGHPLWMRAVLPHLADRSAASVREALQGNLADLGGEADDAHRKTVATLRFVQTLLPAALRPLLVPLSLHERFVHAKLLEMMAKQVDAAWTRARIDAFLGALGIAGLVRDRGQAVYQLHPALTGFLRSEQADASGREAWTRAFVDVMGSLADALAPRPLHEQRVAFHLHRVNLHHALNEAERLGMQTAFAALAQSLAAYAQNTRDFATAEALFARLAEARAAVGDEKGEAGAYHQLGRVAEERRDFDLAQEWYTKALEIFEKLNDEAHAAITYHQLGMVAQKRRDFDLAEEWYGKALAIEEKLGNEHNAASTCHQLGMIAQKRRDFDRAEQWYTKALAIKEKLGNEQGAAGTYHQLGRVAEERRDFDLAEQWYRKALAIFEKLGNEDGIGKTSNQLGVIALERRDFDRAEQWYRNALGVLEGIGNEVDAAVACHQLGRIAQERRDFDQAEGWYKKSLAIEEKLGNEHNAASTYGQLGILDGLRGRFLDAGRWLIRSAQAFARTNDQAGVKQAANNYRVTLSRAPTADQETLKAMWKDAGLGPLPEPPPADHT